MSILMEEFDVRLGTLNDRSHRTHFIALRIFPQAK
jgi:hypothetical protein